jgi:hypothetical protein
LDDVVLTLCPPGPLDRLARSSISLSGISRPGRMAMAVMALSPGAMV